jgi:hypothetical protein
MNNKSHAWPNAVNAVDVSTTTNPVTHTALVIVKNASSQPSRSRADKPGSH